MGNDAMRSRVEIRRFLVISFRLCYRSVCQHPFLVGMVCFLLLLYRSFPLLFSLLVTASPVLISTAILLGTLLSFGEPNIPEIEKEEEVVRHGISLLKAGVVDNATFVVDKDESFCLERVVGKREGRGEREFKDEGLVKNGVREIEGDEGFRGYMPLIDESDNQIERQVNEEVEGEFDDLVLGKKREIQEENLGIKEVLSDEEDQYALLQNAADKNVEDDAVPGELNEARRGDHLEFSQDLSWKRLNDDGEEEDDEASDLESDGAESSSPDASMTDILPVLDELHPLLDEEAPQQAHVSHDGSDAASERSLKSDESSVESEEDVENQADEEEDGDDENDNEEAKGTKEDESKSAIKWTEDDQKNLMDLGTLELERNQRLESLIARRRARRNMRLMAEKNLIDLDAADLPINVPTISTSRLNPFDFPYDDDVPGSAPSILLPRPNPFDLPYDSNEEKPDLKGDSFQQEFMPREPFFRRHESFSVGPSTLGGSRHERQDLRWKPYFVPERFATEGASFHTFQRQSSEASESKVSSVPDTESVSSAAEEDKRINEETEMISNLDHASVLVQRGSLSSEEVDSLDNEQIENSDSQRDGVEIADDENDHDIDSGLSESGEATPIELNTSEILLRMDQGDEDYSSRSSLSSLSEIDEKISDVRKESTSQETTNNQIEGSHPVSTQTSLDSDFHFVSELADDNEQREPGHDHIRECDISTQASLDSDFHFASGVMDDDQPGEPARVPAGDHIKDSGILTERSPEYDLHSLSGVADDSQGPVLESGENNNGECTISPQTSLRSDFNIMSKVIGGSHHVEPVYDSSPPSIETFLSFSSASSDAQRSEVGSPLAVAESEMGAEITEQDISGDNEKVEGSSQVRSRNDRSMAVTENSEPEVSERGLAGVDPNFEGLVRPESAVEHVSVDLPPSSSDNGSADNGIAYKESSQHKDDQQHSSSLDAGIIVETQPSSSYQMDSKEKDLSSPDEDHPPAMIDHASVDMKLSTLEAEPVEEHASGTEKNLQLEEDQGNSQRFGTDINSNGLQAEGEKLDLVDSNSQHVPSNDLHLSAPDERQPPVVAEQVVGTHLEVSSTDTKHMEGYSLTKEETIQFEQADFHQDGAMNVVASESEEKSMVEPCLKTHDEPRELSVTLKESTEELNANKENVPEIYYPEEKMSRNTSSLESDFTSESPNSLEFKTPHGGMNLRDDVFDKIVYEDYDHVLERSNYSEEAFGSHVSENNINEEEDEIKEIDEGLLSELDTVGDFSIKEVGDSLHVEQEQVRAGVGPEFDILPKDSSQEEIKTELPVLEVRSVEDIGMAFKQLNEGASVEEVIVPSVIVSQLAVDKSVHRTNPEFPVVEARSLEDIHTAVKQVSEGNVEELSCLRVAPAEANDVGSAKELPVLEVRTVEDIGLAFKQIHEGVDVEEVIVPSLIEQQLLTDESKDLGQTSSDFPVVEARSLEDLHLAMKKVSEGNSEELSDLRDVPAEANEAGSTKELPILEVRTVEDIDLALKQLHEGVDVEDVILPSVIEQQIVVDESLDVRQTSSGIPVVEARSLKDLHLARKQVSEGNIEEPSESVPAEVNAERSSVELPVLEVGAVEDINLASKQFHEGLEADEGILPSAIEQQEVVNEEDKDPRHTSSDLPVAEARSQEDIQIAMNQDLEGNVKELPKLSDTNDKPGNEAYSTKEIHCWTSESNEVGSSKDTESSTVEVSDLSFTKDVESSTAQVTEVASIKDNEPSTAELGESPGNQV